ncbi:hypothetical protein SAMN05421770_101209 [Granulicella rosea]|uniref:Lipoprotein n=1 Tax=Granulicella rosea TaxID=474952 RepID=A0A239CZ57_9BACT|nr:hypothetical protein [Granulicella rosea]SNS25556.1 hypothetical protein SAMN05421770_101209 [Granulicella rosea]
MKTPRNAASPHLLLALASLAFPLLTGCVVAGYSSSGGAFIWPGGLGLFVLLLLLFLLLRRRD